jgi:hypothetical protein
MALVVTSQFGWVIEAGVDCLTVCAQDSTVDIVGTLDVTGDVGLGDSTSDTTTNYGMLVLPKTTNYGVQVDTTTPTFGFRDLKGNINVKYVGVGSPPNLAVYRGGSIRQFEFAVNEEVFMEFHVPHDYVPGSDLFIHVHWSHNATTVTGGTVTWGWQISYAKGYNQVSGSAFSAEINPTAPSTASTTQYQHIIEEIQLSATSPSATQLDSDDIEIDGVILVRCYLSANAITVSGGGVPDPFLHYCDLHYQSTNIATKDKNHPFYT